MLQKINQILPAVASAGDAAAGLTSSLSGSVGRALSATEDAIPETGISAGDTAQGFVTTKSGIKVNPGNILSLNQ